MVNHSSYLAATRHLTNDGPMYMGNKKRSCVIINNKEGEGSMRD